MRPETLYCSLFRDVEPVGSPSGHGRPRESGDHRAISGLGPAVGAQAPVGDLGLVDREAVFVARFETRGLPHSAVDIMDRPTPAADEMVVVVTDAVLVSDRRACRFDVPQQTPFGADAKYVVHRLGRHAAELFANVGGDEVRSGVRMSLQHLEDRHPRRSHPKAHCTQLLSRARGWLLRTHVFDRTPFSGMSPDLIWNLSNLVPGVMSGRRVVRTRHRSVRQYHPART